MEIFGSFSSTSTRVSEVFILPVSPPKTVSGSVISAQITITNTMIMNGRADVSLNAQAILFRRNAVANNITFG